jgi:hypothetical protein
MGTSSTKNCQGFSSELPGGSGANFIKSKEVANDNTVKCGGKVFNSILKHEFYKTYIKTLLRFAARLPQAGVPVNDKCS